jgi:uncharacterized protein (TIGR03790 family)
MKLIDTLERTERMRHRFLILILATIVAGGSATAADLHNPGDEVVIVYNAGMPGSRDLANYYSEKRHVPANQILGLVLSTNEEVSRIEFRDTLQKPVAKFLETNKLWQTSFEVLPVTTNQARRVQWRVSKSKIRYLLLCYGVPLRIAKDSSLKEAIPETMPPEMRRNEAAVDSELALLPVLEQGLPLAGPLKNPIFAGTNSAWFDPTNGVLMVARLDGPTVAIARGEVDKALDAEKNGLWGRAYFDLRNRKDPAYKVGDDWIRGAWEIARRLGFETVADLNESTFPAGFPMSDIAIYVGWYSESIEGPLKPSRVEFRPGAFAYHLHSFSAATLRSTTQNWVGPLLARGATITMGCVDEPYLAGTPDVGVFLSRILFYQMTFGESAYASQNTLSWQITVVGDPLYRPFGTPPETLHLDLEHRQSKLLEWSNLRLVNLNLANGKPLDEWITFLETLEQTKQSAVLSEKLADLYVAQGKPSSAIYTYKRALGLNPSPQQRIRLLLTLGEKLAAAERNSEATETYRELLKVAPDYPDKAAVESKLSALTTKPQPSAN